MLKNRKLENYILSRIEFTLPMILSLFVFFLLINQTIGLLSYFKFFEISLVSFFSYSSLQGKLADPNWLSGSYIALYIFLAAYFYYLLQKSKKFFIPYCLYQPVAYCSFFVNNFFLAFPKTSIFFCF